MDGFVDTRWYVLVDGQSYGPYNHTVMSSFVEEGRVIANSLISTDPLQGFVAAASLPIFQTWGQAAQSHSNQLNSPTSFQTPENVRHDAQLNPQQYAQQASQTQQPVSGVSQETLFIVMAEIDSKTGMNFLRTLQSFGQVQRISDSVWLVHTQQSLSDVKNALSVSLSKRDRLFIHDCFANQQAWENIGGDLDSRIRQMWQAVTR